MHSLTLSLAMKQKWMHEGKTPMPQQCSCHFSLDFDELQAVLHSLQLYHQAAFQHQGALPQLWIA